MQVANPNRAQLTKCARTAIPYTTKSSQNKTLFQLLCGIDTQGSQEFIQPFHLEYMILRACLHE